MPDEVYRLDADRRARATSTPADVRIDPDAPRSIRARSSAGDVRSRRPPLSAYGAIATIRSIGTRARSAIASGTLTTPVPSRSASRSLGSVIIFM